jgi:crossover junction endodeoxyribonuclease RusA
MVTTYYYIGAGPRLDGDNMIKPIQDALEGLVYVNDRQVHEPHARMINLDQATIPDVSPVLAEGLSLGEEFLHISITPFSVLPGGSP